MKSVSHTNLFEKLESRELRTVTSPTPGDGQDYHLALADNDAVVVSASPEEAARVKLPEFKWMDGTPDQGITGAGNAAFDKTRIDGYLPWPFNYTTGTPDESGDYSEARVRAMARWAVSSGYKVVVIDNETWGFDIRYSTRAEVDHSIARMKQAFAWVRDEEPSLKIGIYGYMAQSDDRASKIWLEAQQQSASGDLGAMYSIPPAANLFASWQATSEYLRPLSESVDYVFPALYTGIANESEWEKSAKTTIEDSRRYGKPVIPFIWPYFHPGIGGSLAGTALPDDYWNRELSLVKEYADGAVIWNNRPTDTNASWFTSLTAASAPETQAAEAAAPMMVAAQSLPLADDADDRRLKFNNSPIDDLFAQAA